MPAVVAQDEPPRGRMVLENTAKTYAKTSPTFVATTTTVDARAEPDDTWVCWADADELVVEQQPRTCCYENQRGQIVLRQEAAYPDEEPYLIFNKEYAGKVIHAFAKYLSPGACMDIVRALDKNYLL